MSRLLVLGAGGHRKAVAEAALASVGWCEIAFLGDRAAALGSGLRLPVLGAIGRRAGSPIGSVTRESRLAVRAVACNWSRNSLGRLCCRRGCAASGNGRSMRCPCGRDGRKWRARSSTAP